MSTDEQYKPIEFREKYVCSDQDEIGWALGKVQQYAKEHDLVMYVIRKNGFYYMTDEYKSVGKRVAIIYPGGRTEIYNRAYEAVMISMEAKEAELADWKADAERLIQLANFNNARAGEYFDLHEQLVKKYEVRE